MNTPAASPATTDALPANGAVVTDVSNAPAGPPHSPPIIERDDRRISHAWNIGDPDADGAQAQAELVVSYSTGSGYSAAVHARVSSSSAWGHSHLYKNIMNAHQVLHHEAKRFSAKTLKQVADRAVDLVRTRCDAADPAILPYFDPRSELHTDR